MNNEQKEHRSGWSNIGEGIGWLLILIGIGGCNWLCSRDSNEPLVIIKHETKP